MIHITGMNLGQIDLSSLAGIEKLILYQKHRSVVSYHYDSLQDLRYELKMRSCIISAAKRLYVSGAAFAAPENSQASGKFWSAYSLGGLRQLPGVRGSEAVRDIFAHGSKYAFNCATAVVLILYKAILDVAGDEVFDAHFRDLLLYDWHYEEHLHLGMTTGKAEAVPGDILYFKNPNYNAEMPEFQGKNVILLSKNLYYGHGCGINTETPFVEELNNKRSSSSPSLTSAYLTDLVEFPDFKRIQTLERPETVAKVSTRFLYSRRIFMD